MERYRRGLATVLAMLFLCPQSARAELQFFDFDDLQVKGNWHRNGETFEVEPVTALVDLDSDSLAEFIIRHEYDVLTGGIRQPVLGVTTSGTDLSFLDMGGVVGPTTEFEYAGLLNAAGWRLAGDDQGEKFIGIVQQITGLPHYGWVRVTVHGDGSIVFHDYALETSAHTPAIVTINPEPHSLVLVVFGLIFMAHRVRRA